MTEQGAACRTRDGERGAILVAGLVGAFVATLLAIALFDLGVVQNRLQRDNECTRRAAHAAESGLLRAYQDIERAGFGTPMNFNVLAPAIGSGTLTTSLSSLSGYVNVQVRTGAPDMYTVQARRVPGAGPRVIRLVATGRVPTTCLQEGGQGAIATVQADLSRASTPLGAPFVGRDLIKLNDKAQTDSYNSFVGKYATSSCPQYDAKSKPIKILGCGGDMWSDGASITKLDKNDCGHAAVCVKKESTIFGSVTAAKGGVYFEGPKDAKKATGGVWGNVSWDSQPSDFGWMFCKEVPCSSVVQGSIIKGSIPNINLNDVTTCATDPADTPSAKGYSSGAWLAGKITVYDDTNKATTCSKSGNKFCVYDDSTGDLVIDEKNTQQVVFNQGQYCLNTIKIKNTTGIALQYDPTPSKVLPVQWNLKGNADLDDKVKKGKAASGEENSPWLFMLLSSCDRNAGCKDIKLKIGSKSPGDDQGLYGYIYAPRAKLKFEGDGDLFGAAVGGRLEINKAQLHFDQALLNLIEICPTCPIPPYLTSKPVDTLSRWKRCVAPPGGECP